MTTNAIIKAGLALWGDRWQAPLASAIGVNRDTVQDWRQGRSRARHAVLQDLLRVAAARQIELAQAIAGLETALAARAPSGPETLLAVLSPATDADDLDNVIGSSLGGDIEMVDEARRAASETTVEIHRVGAYRVVWLPEWGRAGVSIAAGGTGDPIWTDASNPEDAVRRAIEDDVRN